jgi:hypothetical protein
MSTEHKAVDERCLDLAKLFLSDFEDLEDGTGHAHDLAELIQSTCEDYCASIGVEGEEGTADENPETA